MNTNLRKGRLRSIAVTCVLVALAAPAVAATKQLAVVASARSKLQDVPLADLAKLCKGTLKAWPDGTTFTLVVKGPDTPEMQLVVHKLLESGDDAKVAIAKLNKSRQVVKIVDTEEDLLRTVELTPGAVGILDVYSINSEVKVLRVDGKLPFDIGYALKGN